MVPVMATFSKKATPQNIWSVGLADHPRPVPRCWPGFLWRLPPLHRHGAPHRKWQAKTKQLHPYLHQNLNGTLPTDAEVAGAIRYSGFWWVLLEICWSINCTVLGQHMQYQ